MGGAHPGPALLLLLGTELLLFSVESLKTQSMCGGPALELGASGLLPCSPSWLCDLRQMVVPL